MGAQWKQKGRELEAHKKGQVHGKLVREIIVASKLGGGEPDLNARLAAAVEKAKKHSVTRETIERAIKKGTGQTDEVVSFETVTYEGFGPHKVPVIVEIYTDNHQRTAPEMRLLFKKGVLGTAGSNKFLFDHVGLVEAHHPDLKTDLEASAIEAGANDFEVLTHAQNDDIPADHAGARFVTERTAVHAVSTWLREHGWTVVTSELGYVAKMFPVLDDAARAEVGEFLHDLDDHDDVQRVWAALK